MKIFAIFLLSKETFTIRTCSILESLFRKLLSKATFERKLSSVSLPLESQLKLYASFYLLIDKNCFQDMASTGSRTYLNQFRPDPTGGAYRPMVGGDGSLPLSKTAPLKQP